MTQKSVNNVIETNKDKIGAAEMERLFTMISDFKDVPLNPQSYFLDAGCGRGIMAFYLLFTNPGMKAKLLDLDEKYTCGEEMFFPEDSPKEYYTFEKKNLFQNIKTPPGKEGYNLILCIDVLEHIVFYDKIIQNLWKAVFPGGYLYIQTPSNYPSPNYPTVLVFLNNLRQRLYSLLPSNLRQKLHSLFPKFISFGGGYHVRHGFTCKYLKDKLELLEGAEVVLSKEEYTKNPYFPPCKFKARTSVIVRKNLCPNGAYLK